MSKSDETLQKAFGHIPKELPGTNFSFDIIPFGSDIVKLSGVPFNRFALDK